MPFDSAPAVPQLLLLEDHVARICDKAADEIGRRGWTQGRFLEGGAVCLIGAIRAAAGLYPEFPSLDDIEERCARRMGFPPIKHIVAADAAQVCAMSAADWNDSAARTKDEVIARLRAVGRHGD